MDAPTYVSNAEIQALRRDAEVGMAIDHRLGGLLGAKTISMPAGK